MNKTLVLAVAAALGLTTLSSANAHELRRFGKGAGEFGEQIRSAFGHWSEPAREDQPNGIDFTSLYYEDGSLDGNVIDAARGDKVKITKIQVKFFEAIPDPSAPFGYRVGKLLNSKTLCDQTATPAVTDACLRQKLDALDTFGDPENLQPNTARNKYINTYLPTDAGIVGYKIWGEIQDLVEQPDDDPAANNTTGRSPKGYVPMSAPLALNGELFICGAGSKDPRMNPGDPEYDGGKHSFGCITKMPSFGAKKDPDNKRAYGYDGSFAVPDGH